MNADGWDELELALASLVFERALSFEAAIGQISDQYPEHDANVLLLAAISHVTHVDHFLTLPDTAASARSLHHYRVIAALAADIALMEPAQKRCRDLMAFWDATESRVFRVPA